MTSKELNLKLLEFLPEIRELYEDEVSWQEGDDTGSHVVFADVLVPYIIENINNAEIIKRIFAAIEKICIIKDEYADEVIMFSVSENLACEKEVIEKIIPVMGERTTEFMNLIKRNM